MLALATSKLGILAAVVIALGLVFGVQQYRIKSWQVKAANTMTQLQAANTANAEFAAKVAEQNKRIGDLAQANITLMDQAASAAARTRVETVTKIQQVEKIVVPKDCMEAAKWQANELRQLVQP